MDRGLTRRADDNGDTAQESVETLGRARDIIEQMLEPAGRKHIAHAEGKRCGEYETLLSTPLCADERMISTQEW